MILFSSFGAFLCTARWMNIENFRLSILGWMKGVFYFHSLDLSRVIDHLLCSVDVQANTAVQTIKEVKATPVVPNVDSFEQLFQILI